MRLVTIWTLRGMPVKERLHRTYELAIIKIAHRLPRKIAYWSFIHMGVRYMKPDEVVPEVHYTDLLERAGNDIMKDGHHDGRPRS